MKTTELRSSCIPRRKPIEFVGKRFDTIEEVRRALVFRRDSMVQFGEHVLVRQSGAVIFVAPLTVTWMGQVPQVVYDFEREVGQLNTSELDVESLGPFVKKAEYARKSSFRRCSVCGELTPPEHRILNQCHSCFERAGGVF